MQTESCGKGINKMENLKTRLKPIFDLSMGQRGQMFDTQDFAPMGLQITKYLYSQMDELDASKGVIIPFMDAFSNMCGLAYVTTYNKP